MGIFKRGRAKEFDCDSVNDIPHGAGAYNVWDENGERKYTGIAGDLHARAKQHRASGKFGPGDSFAPLYAKEGTTYDDLREWERQKIKKNHPYANKSRGGEGRPIENLRFYDGACPNVPESEAFDNQYECDNYEDRKESLTSKFFSWVWSKFID